MIAEKREPKIGDLVCFDISWADSSSYQLEWIINNRMQYGVVIQVHKRVRRAWDQYTVEWNGQDVLFFGNDDGIEVIGDKG